MSARLLMLQDLAQTLRHTRPCSRALVQPSIAAGHALVDQVATDYAAAYSRRFKWPRGFSQRDFLKASGAPYTGVES